MGRPLSLKPRLQGVAAFIRPTDRVADIGTDHARLPIYLWQQKLCQSVVASDIAAGPLERARRKLAIHGLEDKIPLYLANGVGALDPGETDTVVIAGMGGDSILDIVEKAPWLKEKRLILQPQTKQAALRPLLEQAGYSCAAETEAVEGHRKYTIYVFDKEPIEPTVIYGCKEGMVLCGKLIRS